VVLHNASGLLFGYLTSVAMKVSVRDRRAVMIEGGMQNSGLALGIIAVQFNSDLGMVDHCQPVGHLAHRQRPGLRAVVAAGGRAFSAGAGLRPGRQHHQPSAQSPQRPQAQRDTHQANGVAFRCGPEPHR
jgi:arginine exporter protein ArgO